LSAPGSADDTGLPWRDATCHVKLLSSVPESHHLPDDIKDSTCTVQRRALFDSEYKPGTRLILTPEECARLIGRPADIVKTGSLRGRATTYRTDINADGFAERVVENSFLRVVIGPRFGARIWEICHKRAGWDPLHSTYDFSKDWYELGGQEDHISEQDGPGEFWSARFDEKEAATSETGFRGVYEFKSEKSKGITLVKEIAVPVDAPVVHFRCTIKYAGAEKPPEDGKPDEFEMTFWPRVGVAVPEEKKGVYVFVVPTKTRLYRIRKGQGWHTPRCFGMSAPYILAQDEDTGRCLALLLDPAVTHYGEVKDGRSEFQTIEPKMRQVKLPKDGEQSYGYALVVGDAGEATSDGLSITTTGPRDGRETPIFTLDTRESARPMRRRGVSVEMTEVEYSGLPRVAHGTAWLSRNGGKLK
jgi:hypothetical protein